MEHQKNGKRLNKYLSDSGFCSRREADRLIQEGKVLLDGRPGVLGDRVEPGMRVEVNGCQLSGQGREGIPGPAQAGRHRMHYRSPGSRSTSWIMWAIPSASIRWGGSGQGQQRTFAAHQRWGDRQPHSARFRGTREGICGGGGQGPHPPSLSAIWPKGWKSWAARRCPAASAP